MICGSLFLRTWVLSISFCLMNFNFRSAVLCRACCLFYILHLADFSECCHWLMILIASMDLLLLCWFGFGTWWWSWSSLCDVVISYCLRFGLCWRLLSCIVFIFWICFSRLFLVSVAMLFWLCAPHWFGGL